MTQQLALDGAPSVEEHFLSKAEWLAARRSGIGASEAAAVIGASPFLSPLEL